MLTVDKRLIIPASELEQLARCSHSINYSERIIRARQCRRCQIISELGRFILKRFFRGGYVLTLKGLSAEMVKVYKNLEEDYEVSSKDKVLLNDLLTWGKGVVDTINLIDIPAETHFGQFTVTNRIDAVIYDVSGWAILKFSCDKPHTEQALNYQALFSRMWLQDTYGINASSLLVVAPTLEGLKIQRFDQHIPLSILRESMEHILSTISMETQDDEEFSARLSQLPVTFGEHCWSCNACFQKG